jgi:hypothetical protein
MKKQVTDPFVRRSELVTVVDTMKEIGNNLFEKMEALSKEIRWVAQDLKDFRKEQGQFNKEISQKVEMNTAAIVALDKRVRFQDDMPERLDHVESQQYELTGRVSKLEQTTSKAS